MTIPLSDRTRNVVDTLFNEPVRTQIETALIESVSENVPFCETQTPEGMERIRFAVAKLVAKNGRNLDRIVEVAQTDWRDLLMAAGFGNDIDQHQIWYEEVVSE